MTDKDQTKIEDELEDEEIEDEEEDEDEETDEEEEEEDENEENEEKKEEMSEEKKWEIIKSVLKTKDYSPKDLDFVKAIADKEGKTIEEISDRPEIKNLIQRQVKETTEKEKPLTKRNFRILRKEEIAEMSDKEFAQYEKEYKEHRKKESEE